MWTRDRETGRRETVTLEDAEAMNKKMEGRRKRRKKKEGAEIRRGQAKTLGTRSECRYNIIYVPIQYELPNSLSLDS